MTQPEPLPGNLLSALRRRKLVPFVGSGISKLVGDHTGKQLLPGWMELLEHAAERLREENPYVGDELRKALQQRCPDYLKAAEMARRELRGDSWIEMLRERHNFRYADVAAEDLKTARAVWELGSKLVITTAYDRVLTWACPEPLLRDLQPLIIYSRDVFHDLRAGVDGRPIAWYLLGHAEWTSSMILTPGGQELFPERADQGRRFEKALDGLADLITRRTLLFLGYDLKDHYFLQVLKHLKENRHQLGGPHFALVPPEELTKFRHLTKKLNVICLPCRLQDTHAMLRRMVDEQEQDGGVTQDPDVMPEVTFPKAFTDVGPYGKDRYGAVYTAHWEDMPVRVRHLVVPDLPIKAMSQFKNQRAKLEHLSGEEAIPSWRLVTSGQDWFILTDELFRGHDIRTLKGGTFNLETILHMAEDVAKVLAKGHQRGICHHDLRPDNILVSDSESPRTRVLDFGLLSAFHEAGLFKNENFPGDQYYLSPEQCYRNQVVDGRADIYAVGVILYELLCGHVPFRGEAPKLHQQIIYQPVPPLDTSVDPTLSDLVRRCLSKDPAMRYQRGFDLAEALRTYREGLSRADLAREYPSESRATPTTEFEHIPLFGREGELLKLQVGFDAAVGDECQMILMEGRAGLGKTRLLEELEKYVRAKGGRTLWGRFSDQEKIQPYQAYYEVIRDYFRLGIPKGADAPDLSDLVEDLVLFFPTLGTHADVVELAKGLKIEATSPELTRGGTDQTHVFELIARTLGRFAESHPLAVVVENIDTSITSLDTLKFLFHRMRHAPILIVGICGENEDNAIPRSYLDDWKNGSRFTSFKVKPLRRNEMPDFSRRLLRAGRLFSPQLLNRLYNITKGRPFFIMMQLTYMRLTHQIYLDPEGRWELTQEGLADLNEPPMDEAALLELLFAMRGHDAWVTDDECLVLQAASIVGRRFTRGEIAILTELTNVEDLIAGLCEKGVICEFPHHNYLFFSCNIVWKFVYDRICTETGRRTMHLCMATYLEERFADNLDPVRSLLAFHHGRAGMSATAYRYLLEHARRALNGFNPLVAAHALKIALRSDHYNWDDPDPEYHYLSAWAWFARGNFSGALQDADLAFDLYEEHQDQAGLLQTALLAAEVNRREGRTQDARTWVEKGLAGAGPEHGRETYLKLLRLGAKAANLRAETEVARGYLAKAESLTCAEDGPDIGGGVLNVGISNPVSSIRPRDLHTIEESEICANVFETLLTTDASGRVVSQLAELLGHRYHRIFHFRLKAGVTFSDGVPLSAEVVADCLQDWAEQMEAQPGSFSSLLERVAAVPSKDEGPSLELKIHLKKSLPFFPVLLTDLGSTAVFREVDGKCLGTGPFKLVENQPDEDDSVINLAKHEHYWGGPAKLDGLSFHTGVDAARLAFGLLSGKLDMGRDLLPDDLDALLRLARFRRGLVENPKKNTYFIIFNTKLGPCSHLEVREALAGMLRPQEMVWSTLGGRALYAVSLIPPGIPGHDPGRSPHFLEMDRARELIRESVGTLPKLVVGVHPRFMDSYHRLREELFLKWSGLDIEIEALPAETTKEYLDYALKENGLDVMIGRWEADYADPDNFAFNLFDSRHGVYRRFCSSKTMDDLLSRARKEAREDRRRELYAGFEDELAAGRAVLPLFHDIDYRIAGNQVVGARLSGKEPYVNYREVEKVEKPRDEDTDGRYKGRLVVPLQTTPQTLDPTLIEEYDQAEIIPNIFETLTSVDDSAHVVAKLVDFAAEEHGSCYRFWLRKNVRFQNGRLLTVSDIRYSLKRLILQECSPHRDLLIKIKGARDLQNDIINELSGFEIISHVEFVIRLEEPVSFFPGILSHPATSVVPEGLDFTSDPRDWVGTGPFRLETFEPGKRVVLKANLHYGKKRYPRCRELVFELGADPMAIGRGLQEGRYSLGFGIPMDHTSELSLLKSKGTKWSSFEMRGISTYFLCLNPQREAFADRDRRLQFLDGLDIAQIMTQAGIKQGHGLIPPGLLGHSPQPRGVPRPDKTGDLTTMSLKIFLNKSMIGEFSPIWNAVSQHLDRLKIKTEIEAGVLAGRDDHHEHLDLYIYRLMADYSDTDTFVKMFHSANRYFGNVINNPELDELIEKGSRQSDPSYRHYIYSEVEGILAHQALVVPLFHGNHWCIARPEVGQEGTRYFDSRVGFPSLSYEKLTID